MTQIKNTTQRGQQMIRNYNWSDSYDLYDAYNSPSCRKYRAWQYCSDLMKKYNGHDLKITGHNCMQFSAAFLFEKDDSTYLCYITASDDYEVLYA